VEHKQRQGCIQDGPGSGPVDVDTTDFGLAQARRLRQFIQSGIAEEGGIHGVHMI